MTVTVTVTAQLCNCNCDCDYDSNNGCVFVCNSECNSHFECLFCKSCTRIRLPFKTHKIKSGTVALSESVADNEAVTEAVSTEVVTEAVVQVVFALR